jgi:hypothetical protein
VQGLILGVSATKFGEPKKLEREDGITDMDLIDANDLPISFLCILPNSLEENSEDRNHAVPPEVDHLPALQNKKYDGLHNTWSTRYTLASALFATNGCSMGLGFGASTTPPSSGSRI